MGDRLLTEEPERRAAELILKFAYGQDTQWGRTGTIDDVGWRRIEQSCLAIVETIARAQDAKTDSIIRAEERKALGEWLSSTLETPVKTDAIYQRFLYGRDILALLQGKEVKG